MYKTMIICESDNSVWLAKFIVPTKEFDLKAAIEKTATEYYMTMSSEEKTKNPYGISYREFLENVPDELCLEQRFAKVSIVDVDEIVDWWCIPINVDEIYFESKYSGKIREITHVAVQMAEIWGELAEKKELPPMSSIPTRNSSRNKEWLIECADEYIATGANDMVAFLKNKVETVKLK